MAWQRNRFIIRDKFFHFLLIAQQKLLLFFKRFRNFIMKVASTSSVLISLCLSARCGSAFPSRKVVFSVRLARLLLQDARSLSFAPSGDFT
jgi:hypothetical protein